MSNEFESIKRNQHQCNCSIPSNGPLQLNRKFYDHDHDLDRIQNIHSKIDCS